MVLLVENSEIKTKGHLREAIAQRPNEVVIADPSIFAPDIKTAPEWLEDRKMIAVTKMPKRKWFATIKKNKKGKIVVT